MKQTKDLKIHYVPVGELKPAPYNPRKWDKVAEEKLKESIKRFGLIDPFIVNATPKRKNTIIGGHFRFEMAKLMGFKEVPVVYVNIPSLQKEKELNLRLNRNTGEWDLELLKSFDVDILLDVGFDDGDLADIWDEVISVEDDAFDSEKELQKIKSSKIRPGDLFELGTHRLICGDATDEAVVKTLVGKRRADMAYCDPPYNIKLDYNKGIGTNGKYGGTKVDDHKSHAEYREFLRKTMVNALASCKPDCHFFYWCDENYVGLLQGLYTEVGIENRRTCLWIKNSQNATPQIAFNKAYEPCVYGLRGKPFLAEGVTILNEILNKEVGTGNRMIDDIMDIFNIWLVKRLSTNSYEHPTEKPPSLHEKPLRRCTKTGETVIDLFGGSGSTLIACEQMNRKCLMAEIDPIFTQLIINRYEKLTNKKARKLN
ncbi:DNA modification methylase [Patescibacteria group bacterium]|nr:DNA modification methylase [Patescibacteria group bacterium]